MVAFVLPDSEMADDDVTALCQAISSLEGRVSFYANSSKLVEQRELWAAIHLLSKATAFLLAQQQLAAANLK